MRAYIRAMERRHADGRPLDRRSVASFFVSRVDSEVDKRLAAAGREDLRGRAGLANARAAYQAFQRVFGGDGVRRAARRRLPGPAPLWASTGVKNPAYPDTMYVYGLVAPDTVNTMPLPTLQAPPARADVDRRHRRDDPSADLARSPKRASTLEDVTYQLLREGIRRVRGGR
jgi:transaldolase